MPCCVSFVCATFPCLSLPMSNLPEILRTFWFLSWIWGGKSPFSLGSAGHRTLDMLFFQNPDLFPAREPPRLLSVFQWKEPGRGTALTLEVSYWTSPLLSHSSSSFLWPSSLDLGAPWDDWFQGEFTFTSRVSYQMPRGHWWAPGTSHQPLGRQSWETPHWDSSPRLSGTSQPSPSVETINIRDLWEDGLIERSPISSLGMGPFPYLL